MIRKDDSALLGSLFDRNLEKIYRITIRKRNVILIKKIFKLILTFYMAAKFRSAIPGDSSTLPTSCPYHEMHLLKVWLRGQDQSSLNIYLNVAYSGDFYNNL